MNTPTQAQVEKVTEYTLSYIRGATREPEFRLRSKLRGYKVHLVNKWIKIPIWNSKNYNLADGLTNPFDKVMIVSVFQMCFGDSSFPHELAHVLHDKKIPDWGHDDKPYWDWVKKYFEPQLIRDLCPPDHVHVEISHDYVPPEQK